MNAKIITVWGVNGSGKTTTAVNLAMAIAERGFMVGIISSKLYYGELQGLFGKRVEADKGTYCAILKGCNTKNKFAETENPNLFFLSVHNSFDGMLLTAISGETIKELIDDAVIRFDYIIIDGNEELNNPISSIGLTMADKIINVHRASVKDCIWFSAMSHMIGLLHLSDKTIHILNAYDKTCDKAAYINSLGLKFDFELPFVDNARILENSGKVIYSSRNGTGVYKKIIQRIASMLISEG